MESVGRGESRQSSRSNTQVNGSYTSGMSRASTLAPLDSASNPHNDRMFSPINGFSRGVMRPLRSQGP